MKNTRPSGLRPFRIAALVGALALLAGWAFGAAAKEEWTDPRTVGGLLRVEWLGRVVAASWTAGKPYPPYMHVVDKEGKRQTHEGDGFMQYVSDVEIGLRSDGVLVWRKATK